MMDRRNLLLMDTGPLWELVTYRAVFDLRFQRLRPRLQFVSTQLSYENLGRYIQSFQTKSTSSSVIVELPYRVRGTEPAGQERIWSLIYEEFRGMGMKEQAVSLLDMPIRLVGRYGPTDVSLLSLAQQQIESEPVVLTIDSELRSECLNAGIRAVQIHEITGGRT